MQKCIFFMFLYIFLNFLHIKFIVEQDSKRFDAIGFGLGPRYHQLGNKIDAVFKLTENYWAGNITIQLQIIDFISV